MENVNEQRTEECIRECGTAGHWGAPHAAPVAAPIDFYELGVAARESAEDAHSPLDVPSARVTYYFVRDNPECFCGAEEWPVQLPFQPPIAFLAGYHKAGRS